jgi:hypothetical protein
MKKTLSTILLLFCIQYLPAQQFIKAGKIEFERRTNQHSFLEEEDMFDAMIKESLPKFAVTYYDLIFDEGKSLFKEGREPESRKIHWSINYLVARIFDSVVVIAFYTDEIIPTSGPESFGGLPGMILGLAIPRLHTTWYATKLEVMDNPGAIIPPKTGKKYEPIEFRKQMTDVIRRNEWLKKIAWQTLI